MNTDPWHRERSDAVSIRRSKTRKAGSLVDISYTCFNLCFCFCLEWNSNSTSNCGRDDQYEPKYRTVIMMMMTMMCWWNGDKSRLEDLQFTWVSSALKRCLRGRATQSVQWRFKDVSPPLIMKMKEKRGLLI
jgi:hypothetical protein